MKILTKIKYYLAVRLFNKQIHDLIAERTAPMVRQAFDKYVAGNKIPLVGTVGLVNNPQAIATHIINSMVKDGLKDASINVTPMNGRFYIMATSTIDDHPLMAQMNMPITQENDVKVASQILVGMMQRQVNTVQ